MSRSTLTFLAVAALALTGCSQTVAPTAPVTTAAGTTAAASPTSAAATPSSEPSPTTNATANPGTSQRALIQAGRTAQNAVPGSTVTSLDLEQNGKAWEVELTTSDGTEHEVHVSADGSKILSGPSVEHDDADDMAKHVRRVKAATVDFEAAAGKVLSHVPNGTILELELDEENGVVVWEAEVNDSTGAKFDVLIDAGSGELIFKKPNN